MALLYPKIPCVIVDTGGNYWQAWENIRRLRVKGHRIIVLASLNKHYPYYYDYIKAEDLKPFYKSCSHKAKQHHLDYFYRTVGPAIVNIGLTIEEKNRKDEFKNDKWIKYNFPLIKHEYTREMCEKLLRKNRMLILKTGCWFCGKQPRESWERLRVDEPDKYQEALERGWVPEAYITTNADKEIEL